MIFHSNGDDGFNINGIDDDTGGTLVENRTHPNFEYPNKDTNLSEVWVSLAIQANPAYHFKAIDLEFEGTRLRKKDYSRENTSYKTYNNMLSRNVRFDVVQNAYLGKRGTAVNLTCFSPEPHFWYSLTSNFIQNYGRRNNATKYNFPTKNSPTIELLRYKSINEAKARLHIKEDLTMMRYASTLRLKNLSTADVGPYECYMKADDEGEGKEILFQTLYLYVDDWDSLTAPTDYLPKNNCSEFGSDDGDLFVITGEESKNVILPCRPSNPEVKVDLFKQVPTPKQRIPNPIEDELRTKVISSQYFERHLTTLFYFHPRIGFVLNSVTLEDEGRYHCRFTSSYKLEEIKTFEVTLSKGKCSDLKHAISSQEGRTSNFSAQTVTSRSSHLHVKLDSHSLVNLLGLVLLKIEYCVFSSM